MIQRPAILAAAMIVTARYPPLSDGPLLVVGVCDPLSGGPLPVVVVCDRLFWFVVGLSFLVVATRAWNWIEENYNHLRNAHVIKHYIYSNGNALSLYVLVQAKLILTHCSLFSGVTSPIFPNTSQVLSSVQSSNFCFRQLLLNHWPMFVCSLSFKLAYFNEERSQ